MKCYSTGGTSPSLDIAEAVMQGLAPDGGLYMPESIPKLPEAFLRDLQHKSFTDIALEVSRLFFEKAVPDDVLQRIVTESFDFPVPIVELDPQRHVLELFHGPTLAFKDFAARFMAWLMAYLASQRGEKLTILVATSGDTGSAVAHGFLGVENIEVIILYPSGKVSHIQEQQLTTMGQNIRALEVQGTFDDCQAMVKRAFQDSEITKKRTLASANSINIARLLPQSFYYVWTAAQLQTSHPLVICVPSGNFGNLTAGLIAKRMGAPIDQFIAATNVNDTVPHYLATGEYVPKTSQSTISNAMDVGSPSNFTRMLELYDSNVENMKQDIAGVSFTDEQTRSAIVEIYKKYNYMLDPHGAVAYLGLESYLQNHPETTGVLVETAHPAKFTEIVEETLHTPVPMPERLAAYLDRKKEATVIGNTFEDLKGVLV